MDGKLPCPLFRPGATTIVIEASKGPEALQELWGCIEASPGQSHAQVASLTTPHHSSPTSPARICFLQWLPVAASGGAWVLAPWKPFGGLCPVAFQFLARQSGNSSPNVFHYLFTRHASAHSPPPRQRIFTSSLSPKPGHVLDRPLPSSPGIFANIDPVLPASSRVSAPLRPPAVLFLRYGVPPVSSHPETWGRRDDVAV